MLTLSLRLFSARRHLAALQFKYVCRAVRGGPVSASLRALAIKIVRGVEIESRMGHYYLVCTRIGISSTAATGN